MGAWYDDEKLQGNYIKLPEGTTKELYVKEIRRVEERDSKFNFKSKDGVNAGYHYELETHDGKILTIAAYSLLTVLKNAKVDANMKIKISHVGKGQYTIQILETDAVPF